MKWPWTHERVLHTWTYQPYGFESGVKYVIEINMNELDLHEVKELNQYFLDHGIICKLVLTKTGTALQPVKVKSMTEEA